MKAISPVIATVIIVAVAIAIAVAVAFWMTGITGTFTRYEKLEITYAYAEYNETSAGWNVTLKVQNTGPSDATVDDIFINGKPLSTYGNNVQVNESLPMTITSGSTKVVIVTLLETGGFGHGQTVEIKLHTAAGNEYPKQVTLP